MLSAKRLHLRAPVMKLQGEEICQFPLMPLALPSLVTMLRGHLMQWSLVSDIPQVTQTNASFSSLLAWKTATRNLTPNSIHPGRLAGREIHCSKPQTEYGEQHKNGSKRDFKHGHKFPHNAL